jgi:hypothetical protein
MPTTSYKFFTTTGFDVAGFAPGGLNNWTNPTNAYADDSSYTTAGNPSLSRYQSYGSPALGIPAGATIDGIEVEAVAYRGGSNIGLTVGIHQGSGTWRTKTVTLTSGTDQTCSYGGAADLWGGTWTQSNFTDANFALYIGIDAYGDTVYVDYVKIRVTYTEADITIVPPVSTINIEAKIPSIIPSVVIQAVTAIINIGAKIPSLFIRGSWNDMTKHNATASNQAKNNATPSDMTKHNSTWTNRNKYT